MSWFNSFKLSQRAGRRNLLSAFLKQLTPFVAPAKKCRRPAYVRLFLEPLEDRTLLSSSIFGSVFNDVVPTHPGLSNVSVYLDPTITYNASAPAITSGAAGSFAPFGGFASTLSVANFPGQLVDVAVNINFTYSSTATNPIQVGLVSPLGFTVPNNPNIFNILPGETFSGTFDDNAATSEAAVSGLLTSGTYRPQQYFTDPQAHIFDGNPNGTWGLVFFPPAGSADLSKLTLNSWSLTFTAPGVSTQTDAHGNYSFTGVQPGDYRVTLAVPPADAPTTVTATNVFTPVSVAANQTITGVNLGVQPTPQPTPVALNPTNTSVATSTSAQNSPSIAVDPLDPNHQVVAYLDYGASNTGYAGIGVAVSSDGGKHWTDSSIPLPASFDQFDQGASDPKAHFDSSGHVYVSFMAATFLGTLPSETDPSGSQRSRGFTSNNGIFVARGDLQTDGSVTWNTPVFVDQNFFSGSNVPFDVMPDSAVDSAGNVYVTWARFYPAGQYPGTNPNVNNSDVMIAVSTNGGVSFTTEMQTQGALQVSAIRDPNYQNQDAGSAGRGYLAFPGITTGPDGNVYVVTYSGGNVAVFRSSDGGATFTTPNYTYNIGLPLFQQGGTAISSAFQSYPDNFATVPIRDIVADPSHPGRIYVATSMAILNPPVTGTALGVVDVGDIVFARSDDDGLTWQHLFTVGPNASYLDAANPSQNDNLLAVLNDDNASKFVGNDSLAQLQQEVVNGQFMPAMAVDAQGNLTVIWYDTRRNPNSNIDTQGNPGGLLDIFGTVSSDGGLTFTPNFRLTDTTFDPNAGAFTNAKHQTDFFLGNAIGVAAVNGMAYAVWTDTRNGNQDVYTQQYPIAGTVPAPGADRLSPNNTLAMASQLGPIAAQQVYPLLALPAGSSDEWFNLQAGATGTLVVSVTASTSTGTLNPILTDANGNPLSGGTITNILDASGAVVGKQLVFPSVSGQNYWIDVHGQSTAGISYTLVAESLTADLGTQVEGVKADTVAQGAVNLYRLTAGVQGILQVDLTAGAQGNLNLSLLGADGATVLASDPPAGLAAGQSETLDIAVTAGETVFLQVSGANLSAASGDFTLEYTNLDQFETPGLTTAFIPTIGTPTSLAVANLNGKDNPPSLLVSNTNATDSVGVLTSNGNGTFQAERQYGIGPGLAGNLNAGDRQIQVADLNGDGIADVIVPNFNAANVSVLLGNGDGTFQPQRQFDAVSSPTLVTTGVFTASGNTDAIVLQNFAQSQGAASFAFLRNLGQGTFAPPQLYQTVFSRGISAAVTGNFTGSGHLDLLVFSFNDSRAELFPGNGNGTFQAGHVFAIPEATFSVQAIDLTGDGHLDLITTSTNSGKVYVLLGNGNGTFQTPQAYQVLAPQGGGNVIVKSITLADFGSAPNLGAQGPGPADGIPDLIAVAAPLSGGAAQVIFLPGLVDKLGHFAGFGAPVSLATVSEAGPLVAGDFQGNGVTDLAVANAGGVTVIYGTPLSLPANNTPATARNLGNSVHFLTQPQAIVPGFTDAYYTYTVPTEAAPGAGPEVIDISALFQNTTGFGLSMQVFGQGIQVLQSNEDGSRIEVLADQGTTITIEVSSTFDPSSDFGVYTLDVDVLPQLVSAQAESVLPGGPLTSLVLTLQGDRLDPASAENPANYTVYLLGNDGVTPVGFPLPLSTTPGTPSVVYDGAASLGVAIDREFPDQVRQTITLLFAKPLTAGAKYLVQLSPNIQTASLNAGEASLLVGSDAISGHPVVLLAPLPPVVDTKDTSFVQFEGESEVSGPPLDFPLPAAYQLLPGSSITATATPQTGSLNDFNQGTSFFSQMHDDLGANLDALLAAEGDDPSITAAITAQILSYCVPGWQNAATKTPLLIIWLDPVSIDLTDPGGDRTVFNLQTNTVSNNVGRTFLEVGGAVEVMVIAAVSGAYNLNVSDVQASARGGAIMLEGGNVQTTSLTEAIRNGDDGFQFAVSQAATLVTTTTFSSSTNTFGLIADTSSTLVASLSNTLAQLAGSDAAQEVFAAAISTAVSLHAIPYGVSRDRPNVLAEIAQAITREVEIAVPGFPVQTIAVEVFDAVTQLPAVRMFRRLFQTPVVVAPNVNAAPAAPQVAAPEEEEALFVPANPDEPMVLAVAAPADEVLMNGQGWAGLFVASVVSAGATYGFLQDEDERKHWNEKSRKS